MTHKRIMSLRFPHRTAHNRDLLLLLGQAGTKWPDAGLPTTVVQGVKVWVAPITRVPGRKSSAHRVMAECTDCGAVMSAGRLFQHKCFPGAK